MSRLTVFGYDKPTLPPADGRRYRKHDWPHGVYAVNKNGACVVSVDGGGDAEVFIGMDEWLLVEDKPQ